MTRSGQVAVAGFLAILELARLNLIRIHQTDPGETRQWIDPDRTDQIEAIAKAKFEQGLATQIGMLQAKSSRLSLANLLGAGLRPLSNEVLEKFSAHVAQVIRYVRRVQEDFNAGDLRPEAREISN